MIIYQLKNKLENLYKNVIYVIKQQALNNTHATSTTQITIWLMTFNWLM